MSRLLIHSNTERFLYIQSVSLKHRRHKPVTNVYTVYTYIPVTLSCLTSKDSHTKTPSIIHAYCDQYNIRGLFKGPYAGKQLAHSATKAYSRQLPLSGGLIYYDVDAYIKSYILHLQSFLLTRASADFLTIYTREWKLYKRGAYYIGRMLTYITRHWVRQKINEGRKDVYEVGEMFFVRWRTRMNATVRERINASMGELEESQAQGRRIDQRVKDAVEDSLGGPWRGQSSAFA
jgi:hypothetical protein